MSDENLVIYRQHVSELAVAGTLATPNFACKVYESLAVNKLTPVEVNGKGALRHCFAPPGLCQGIVS